MIDQDDYLTIEETLAHLKISRATLWRWRRSGLEETRLGRIVRIKRANLDDYLQKNTSKRTFETHKQ
jgi:excisionase family DNA binding protein